MHALLLIILFMVSIPAIAEVQFSGFKWSAYDVRCDNQTTACISGEAVLDSGTSSSFVHYRYICTDPEEILFSIGMVYENGKTWEAYDCRAPTDCDVLTHEAPPDTDPDSVHTACGYCETGWIDAGEDFNGIRCQLIEEQEDCAEKGEMYQGLETGGYCTPVCKSGSALGNICLDVPDDSCSADSEDYIGSIGFGSNQKPVCGDNKCPQGGTYGFEEQADGSYQSTCFPEDSHPPQCPAGAALIVSGDQYTFQCSQINFDGKDDDNPDGSNGDSDGDGQGDLTGIAGQLEDIKKLMETGNTNTSNINETLKQIGKNITDGTAALTEAIGNIPGGGGGGGSGTGSGDNSESVTWTGEAIDTELTDPNEEYEQAMADYQAKLNEIKSEIRAMFGTSLTGGGSVDDNIKTIHGVEVNFSLNRFLEGFNILGAIVLFCAAFISAGILFTGRG